MMNLTPIKLRCEYIDIPLGIDAPRPRLSWTLHEEDPARRGARQTAYRIVAAETQPALEGGGPLVWDTGKRASAMMNQIEYEGMELRSAHRYCWRVQVWDEQDREGGWSEVAWWSMGLLDPSDWRAAWIEAPGDREPYKPWPCPLLRREFAVNSPIRRATLYVTALGLYELRINGRKVGDHVLAPEWTDYHQRVQYQTFDVKELIQRGDNVMGAILADGWYAGRLGLQNVCPHIKQLYGTKPALLAQLRIERADGAMDEVVTSGDWRCTLDGPWRSAGLLSGERYDARRELPGWDHPGFDATAWSPVQVRADQGPKLVAQMNEPIRVTEERQAVAMTAPAPGVYVYDLGQNMVGWCRVRLSLPAGETVTLRHAEVLNPDGTIYRDNLRLSETNKDCQIDHYTAAGHGVETFEPRFTYHGFRYLELTGVTQPPALADVTGCVVHSAAPPAGGFACSDPSLSQLFQNIVWTQRGNLHGVPTDCPQRDERLGWTGDAQVYAQTAIFTMDMAAFFTKWLQDIRDAQAPDGRFPDIAPNPYDSSVVFSGNPGWADVGVILPWRLYLNYGDVRALRQPYPAARRWIEFVRQHNPDLIWKNRRSCTLEYGDWLNGDTLILDHYPRSGGEVPRGVYATAFFAHSTELLSRMAKVLGEADDADRYQALAADIRRAFNVAFVADDGRIEGDTQAGYALALAFDLLPEALRSSAAERMARRVRDYDGRIATGIQSTIRLMLALSRFGRDDVAWQLMTNRRIPSWLYMVDHGGTTVWERWDGWVEGRGFQNPGMNSFNHYAIGAVGEWMMRAIVGINDDPARPGFERCIIWPRFPKQEPGTVTWAEGHYDSIRGRIRCRWERNGEGLVLTVRIPANMTATVCLPSQAEEQVTESGRPVRRAPGVRVLGVADGCLRLAVESGAYDFRAG
jgi:alpha-L-rhamnosidase